MATSTLHNVIRGGHVPARSGAVFTKSSPVDGAELSHVPRSGAEDIDAAVAAAADAQPQWAALAPGRRGSILMDVAIALRTRRTAIAEVVARETGKSPKDALAETDGAVALGIFMAGEGQR